MRAPRRPVQVGERIGRLTILARSGVFATYRCDCGTTRTIRASGLRRHTSSCGCWASERMRTRNLTHGETTGRPSTEWITWRSMRQRCENPKHKSYASYGGRGITVCPEWGTFEVFFADMGSKPRGLTLERSDNEKGYSKDNCIWATRSAQAINRRERQRLDDGTYAPGACAP